MQQKKKRKEKNNNTMAKPKNKDASIFFLGYFPRNSFTAKLPVASHSPSATIPPCSGGG